ncbi:hypothetical protein [Niabella aurantiaca]|uniref:hypothetical protein n=1 Tax=Niabella aurantiaca TaxID=379900 RepID=UPI00037A0ACF|nr:hypothetical protein [Niabella aurantiaca]
MQELIAQSLIQQSIPVSGKAGAIIVRCLEVRFERYPFLRSNPKVRDLYIIGLASATADLFYENPKAAADRYLKRYLDLMGTNLPVVKEMQPYWAIRVSEAYILSYPAIAV